MEVMDSHYGYAWNNGSREGSNRGPKRGPKMDPFWSSRSSEPSIYGHPFRGVFTPNDLVELGIPGMDWEYPLWPEWPEWTKWGILDPWISPTG